GRYRDVSYRHLRRQTLRLASILGKTKLEGERVALWGPNSPEWMVCYLATLFAGAVAVPMRLSLPRQASLRQLADSHARIAFVQDIAQVERLAAAKEELQDLERVLVFDADEEEASRIDWPPTQSLSSLVAERLQPEERDRVVERALAVSPESLATISYTTTQSGEPLGAIFDHGQRTKALEHIAQWFELGDDDLAFTALPWGQAASLDSSLHYLRSGVPNVLSHSFEVVFEEIQQASPTLAMLVPHALERAYDEIIDASVRRLPESTQEMFYWALGTGKKMRAAGETASQELRDRYARADRTFFSRIRGSFGGRFRRFFCTGAPLSRGLAESINAIGLEPINLYSVTEAGGFPAVNIDGPRADSCGQAAAGFEIKISELGEILVRGPSVMRGYWGRPKATAKVLDDDGWLHTGDMGEIGDDGFLTLTGRAGGTLLLSTGRRVDPRHVEKLLTANPFVDQAAVFGDGRPYVAALLVPDLEALATFVREHHPEDTSAPENLHAPSASSLDWFWQVEGPEVFTTSADPRVARLLQGVVERVNAQLDEWECVERFSLIGHRVSSEADRMAEALTHHRGEMEQIFSDQLRAMYPRGAVTADREITQVTLGPERLRELLEKESVLDAWTADAGIDFLFDVARAHGIDTPSVVHMCDAATSVAQMELEEKPLSTAFIVGDPVRIHRVLPPSVYRLFRHDHIRRLRSRLVELAGLVDGQVLGYVVDRHGYVRGICRLETALPEEPRTIFGPQFRLHAEISRRCDAVVFFVPRGGRQVRIFARGELKGRYSSGDWSAENASEVEETLERVAAEKGEDPALLRRLVRCAFRMSEENQGAIFMLGDADSILTKSDPSNLSRFAWLASAPVAGLSDEELIAFAKQDGATVIDSATGRFRGCMILLRPDASTRADIGEGKGARHSSAAKTSAETGALALTVSQDGPITLYDSGRRVLSL
ncbi:MAG: AMP-binding protein, partial [Acidobacteriota bacterium]